MIKGIMHFDSFKDFLAMGKHGLHVWLSYGFFVVCLMILLGALFMGRRRLENELKREGIDL